MDLYSTYALLQVVRVQKSIPKFWSTFFGRVFLSTTDEIALDKVSDNYRRLAPFVAPNVQGRMLKKFGSTTLSFRPAYVKPKHDVDPNTDLVRQPGEAFATGSLTLAQRRNAVIGSHLQTQRNMIDNRIEWMCLQAAVYGRVTISGEDYPTTTVDFRRNADQTVVLAGAAKWDQGTATPVADIMAMRVKINESCGDVANRVVFGRTAWSHFYAKEVAGKEATILNREVRGSEVAISMLSNGFTGVEYMGTYRGSNGAGFECWIYTAKYEDDEGVMQDMLNPGAVVVMGDMMDGVQAFGRIRDIEADFGAMKYFPKNWRIPDPSMEYVMTQSEPISIPAQPNATGMIQTV
jgi:hypothetical protein